MTDNREKAGRIDLRSLDVDQSHGERVMASVMDRIRVTPQTPADPLLDLLERSARPVRIVAGLLAAAAVVVVVLTESRRDSEPPVPGVVAAWAQSQHVPTNGELLATFQGYNR
jgi:hypothetical protein